ncbi:MULTISPECIES: tetratricopeptide repeat protein [Thiorhodovibrio]|uniref:tetratricopeptide repeat protein n=1 Tax=Thiorhodovibrio TaxID=61593 RepID=UPI001912DA33|nr:MULTISPECIES: tetratricopeptide repeat protein [Thiorhodovibrio]MBK5971158.1 hypothetical protein [Thiorhodovibrio winogradskyi]WPL10473.1 Sel1 repeat [Thiorhodovibrio litoralis]
MQTIHFNTAMAITGLSRSSLWRRISTNQGSSETVGEVRGHTRVRINLDSALAWAKLSLQDDDRELILSADAEHADAQCDLGLLLLEVGHPKRAIYWLEKAAAQGFADAMQWLSQCYARGDGVEPDEAQAAVWLKKAAQHGSVIAQRQVEALGL